MYWANSLHSRMLRKFEISLIYEWFLLAVVEKCVWCLVNNLPLNVAMCKVTTVLKVQLYNKRHANVIHVVVEEFIF